MIKIFVLFASVTFLFGTNISRPTQSIVSLKEIKSVSACLHLEKAFVWGEDCEEVVLKNPTDIVQDYNGNLYISEFHSHTIKRFSQQRTYLQCFGQRGQGPGDLIYPGALSIDQDRKIWVADRMNNRIQRFSLEGKFLSLIKTKTMPDQVLISNDGNPGVISRSSIVSSPHSLLTFYLNQGKTIKTIGKYPIQEKSGAGYSDVFACNNKQGIYYVAYKGLPLIEKYSPDGDLLLQIIYDLSEQSRHLQVNSESGRLSLVNDSGHWVTAEGIAVDDAGNIFLACMVREKTEKEKRAFSLGFNGSDFQVTLAKGVDPSKTDLYQILTFSPNGKILSRIPLEVYVNRIRIIKNRLYVVDTFMNSVIYEYNISSSPQ